MRPLHEDIECKNQWRDLKESHCTNIVAEAHASAKKRIKLNNMMDQLEQGDKIIVTKLYILADSTRHLAELLHMLEAKGAFLKSLQEGIDTSHDADYSFRYLVDQMVAFQSDVISESTKRGLSKAKQKGVTAGRPRKPDENVQRAIFMYESKKFSLAEIKMETGISKSTLYRYLEN